MATIFVGIPSYLSQMHADILYSYVRATRNHERMLGHVDSSACAMTFNMLWIQALELAEQKLCTHFLMWHTDILPEDWFIDKMMDLMEKTGADVLSAVAPLKSNHGSTSTAIDEPVGDEDPYFRVRRLTLKEVHAMPEKTFTDPKLLLNTGLMLVDLRKPWPDDCYFTIEDKIIRYRGKRTAVMMPEDWGFSRMARKAGKSLWATREVALRHMGMASFPNNSPWGDMERDSGNPPLDPVVEAAVAEAVKVRGYMTPDELYWLAANAKGKDTVLEIGSWLGRSTKAMAATVGGRVYAVDHWKGTIDDATLEEAKLIDPWAEFNHNLSVEINSHKVEPVPMEHAALSDENPSYFCGMTLAYVPIKDADMTFIDGDHAYEAVVRDIENAKRLTKPGGLISGHDFCDAHPGVMKAVREMVPGARIAPGTTIWYATNG